jgi:chromosomal replication initiation ATPase DnaA
VNAVSRWTGVPESELLSDDRAYRLRRARLLLWAVLRVSGRSYPEIGRAAKRDHSTIMYGLKDARIDWTEAHRVYNTVTRP